MQAVTIYTTRYCGFCIRAKSLLDSKGIKYKEIPADGNAQLRQQLVQRTGSRTVPQIWIGETHIGGCQELYALDHSGKLDELLQNQST